MKPLYHRLDPLWSRWPWPDTVDLEAREMAGATRLRVVRRYFGREVMPVFCYAVGDTMVDSAFPAARVRVLGFAEDRGIRRTLLTHHHEDHAGNAAALLGRGVAVLAGEATAAILARDLPLPFYQHLAWGRMPPARVGTLPGETVALGPYEARVVPAPGHAVDQVVYHVPERGWLFSGDVFIHEKIKVFRRDEDFAVSLATLERILKLPFDVLFCGHRPLAEGGREAIARKLERLRELEGNVRRLAGEGAGEKEIVRRLGLAVRSAFVDLTFGDATPRNLVRSILHGPTPRPEVEGHQDLAVAEE